MKRMIVLSISIWLIIVAVPVVHAAEVKNVTVKQTGNRMLCEYDLMGDEGVAEVNVTLTVKGHAYSSDKLHMEGDLGKVKPGSGKKIWWNVLQDFPRGVSDDVEWDVAATTKERLISKPAHSLNTKLGGKINKDSFLTLSNSPYRIANDLIITGTAILHIQPGVIIQYDRNTSIIVEDGGVLARGTADLPILFTASGPSPAPGSYANAVRFTKQTKTKSVLSYCIVEYATTAFDIYYGTPEISFCHIAKNAQSGVYCRNDAAPQISYSTFEDNIGEGGIKGVGMSNPSIRYNNFLKNAVSVQGFSSIYIDARNNWWGADPPDTGLIWGDLDRSISIKPWLTVPEEKAFRGRK